MSEIADNTQRMYRRRMNTAKAKTVGHLIAYDVKLETPNGFVLVAGINVRTRARNIGIVARDFYDEDPEGSTLTMHEDHTVEGDGGRIPVDVAKWFLDHAWVLPEEEAPAHGSDWADREALLGVLNDAGDHGAEGESEAWLCGFLDAVKHVQGFGDDDGNEASTSGPNKLKVDAHIAWGSSAHGVSGLLQRLNEACGHGDGPGPDDPDCGPWLDGFQAAIKIVAGCDDAEECPADRSFPAGPGWWVISTPGDDDLTYTCVEVYRGPGGRLMVMDGGDATPLEDYRDPECAAHFVCEFSPAKMAVPESAGGSPNPSPAAATQSRVSLMGHANVIGEVRSSPLVAGGIVVHQPGQQEPTHYGPSAVFCIRPLDEVESRWLDPDAASHLRQMNQHLSSGFETSSVLRQSLQALLLRAAKSGDLTEILDWAEAHKDDDLPF